MGRVGRVDPGRTRILPDDARVVRIGELERRIESGETADSIADDLGVTYQAIAWHLRHQGWVYNKSRGWQRQ